MEKAVSSRQCPNYFPAIELCDNYELGLMIFETYHTIPNVNELSNKFYFGKDDAEITISKDSYEVREHNINEFLKHAILWKRPRRDALEIVDIVRSNNSNNDIDDDGKDGEYPITFRANYMMRCEIRCAYRINFNKHKTLDRCWDSRQSVYCDREEDTNRMCRST